MLNTVFSWRRELMSESLDRLVRQCDAKLPRVAPSLFERPLTEATWLVFLRSEEIRMRRSGDEMQELSLVVRQAILDPTTKKLERVVERWLPDEDALREVVIATRPAVSLWWSDPTVTFGRGHLRLLWLTRDPLDESLAVFLAALDHARDLLGDDRVAALDLERSLGLSSVRDGADVAEAARRFAEVVAAPDGDEWFVWALFSSIASGRGADALARFEDRLELERLDVARRRMAAMLRARFGAPDLERVWAPRDT